MSEKGITITIEIAQAQPPHSTGIHTFNSFEEAILALARCMAGSKDEIEPRWKPQNIAD